MSECVVEPHRLLVGLGVIDAAVTDLVGVEPMFMETADKAAALVAVTDAMERLAEVRLRVLACAEDVADRDGARDPGVWLAHTRLDRGECQSMLKLAKDLDIANPGVRDAIRDGVVNTAQAQGDHQDDG